MAVKERDANTNHTNQHEYKGHWLKIGYAELKVRLIRLIRLIREIGYAELKVRVQKKGTLFTLVSKKSCIFAT